MKAKHKITLLLHFHPPHTDINGSMVYLLELVKTMFSNDEGNMLIDECKLMKLLLGCMYYTHKPYSELNIKILDINFTVFCLKFKVWTHA